MNDNAKQPDLKKPIVEGPKTIAVRTLTFYQAHPNFGARTSIKAEPEQSKNKVTIEFVPSLRHHRVEMYKPEATAAVIVFVHESHVSGWEPLL